MSTDFYLTSLGAGSLLANGSLLWIGCCDVNGSFHLLPNESSSPNPLALLSKLSSNPAETLVAGLNGSLKFDSSPNA